LSALLAIRLADRAGQTEELSVGELFRSHAPFVWRLLCRLGVTDADADDMCQEVFLTVQRKLPTFEGRSSVQTWLYGITVRTAADYRRRRRGAMPSEPPPELSRPGHQEDDVALIEAQRTLDSILRGLDEDKRVVFVLYEIEELTMPEVAEVVGCPLQTAYSRLHTARREFQEAVRRFQAREKHK
jgi:RNA polymerase sigma-70 factor (ECF subfamily)